MLLNTIKTGELSQSDSRQKQSLPAVWVTVPGGEDGQGGIVRQMLYFREAAAQYEPDVPLVFLQTRSTSGVWLPVWVHSWFQLVFALLRGRVRHLHLNISSNASFYRKYGLFLPALVWRKPVTAHLHSGGFKEFYDGSNALGKWMIRHLFCRSDSVLILGEYWRAFMEQTLGVDANKLRVLPNAVKAPKQPVTRSDEGTKKLLFLGQLTEKKGAQDLIEALSDPRFKQEDWHLTMAGGGDLDAWQHTVNQAGLADNITLPGWVGPQEVERLCHACHIMVLPSHVENQPLTLLEAMAYRMLILSTTVGTIPEVIRHGETGFLVEPKNVNALTDELFEIITQYNQKKIMADQANLDYKCRYSTEILVKSLIDNYSKT